MCTNLPNTFWQVSNSLVDVECKLSVVPTFSNTPVLSATTNEDIPVLDAGVVAMLPTSPALLELRVLQSELCVISRIDTRYRAEELTLQSLNLFNLSGNVSVSNSTILQHTCHEADFGACSALSSVRSLVSTVGEGLLQVSFGIGQRLVGVGRVLSRTEGSVDSLVGIHQLYTSLSTVSSVDGVIQSRQAVSTHCFLSQFLSQVDGLGHHRLHHFGIVTLVDEVIGSKDGPAFRKDVFSFHTHAYHFALFADEVDVTCVLLCEVLKCTSLVVALVAVEHV